MYAMFMCWCQQQSAGLLGLVAGLILTHAITSNAILLEASIQSIANSRNDV